MLTSMFFRPQRACLTAAGSCFLHAFDRAFSDLTRHARLGVNPQSEGHCLVLNILDSFSFMAYQSHNNENDHPTRSRERPGLNELKRVGIST